MWLMWSERVAIERAKEIFGARILLTFSTFRKSRQTVLPMALIDWWYRHRNESPAAEWAFDAQEASVKLLWSNHITLYQCRSWNRALGFWCHLNKLTSSCIWVPQPTLISLISQKFRRITRCSRSQAARFDMALCWSRGSRSSSKSGSLCPYHDYDNSHKTRGASWRGLILTNDEELLQKINSAIFPWYSRRTVGHVIAAKAVAFKKLFRSCL